MRIIVETTTYIRATQKLVILYMIVFAVTNMLIPFAHWAFILTPPVAVTVHNVALAFLTRSPRK